MLNKSQARFTEEQTLLRAFKFVDMENSGYCDVNMFLKAMRKIGINSIDEENAQDYFALYDREQRGEISYNDLVTEIFNPLELKKRRVLEGNDLQISPKKPQQASQSPQKPLLSSRKPNVQSEKYQNKIEQNLESNKKLLGKMQDAVRQAGRGALFNMEKRVRKMDQDNTGNLDIDGFERLCQEFFNLTPNEIKEMFSTFDPGHTGYINYDDFLQVLHGTANETRNAIIEELFNYLDKNHLGYVDINELSSKFNATKLPEVANGKKHENAAKEEFTEPLAIHHEYFDTGDNKITYDEFIDFFECLSFYTKDDCEFEDYIKAAFGLRVQKVEKEGNVKQEEPRDEASEILNLLVKLRAILVGQGAKGVIKLLKNFREIDKDNAQGCDYDEFQLALQEIIEQSKGEIQLKDVFNLFNMYDIKQKNVINYNQFIDDLVLRNYMQLSRVRLLSKIFTHMDFECTGTIDVNEMKKIYTEPKGKSPNPLPDLLEAFVMYHFINRGSRNPLVRERDFIDFYSLINFLIPEGKTDKLFEDFVSETWRLYDQTFEERKNLKQQSVDTLGKQKNRELKEKLVGSKKAPYGVNQDKINYNLNDPKPTMKYNVNKISDVIAHFRNEMLLRGTRGIMALRRTFMLNDESSTHTLTYEEFMKVMNNFRICMEDVEFENLFKAYDFNQTGEIDYHEFIKGILGDLNNFRKKVLENVFNKLDSGKKGSITVGTLREEFTPGQHPDCRLGKRNEYDILAEFIDVLEYHFNLLNEKNGETQEIDDIKIDFEDFIDFYKNISITIEDDRMFEITLYGEWGVGAKQPFQRGWRGLEN